jgi:SpoVK/Ycf46/Vps4 family AAA+-type ATPase
VATANDVTRLPPEFLRKGRFDEVFFVDLPDPEARRAIFSLHLKKRGHDAANFGVEALVDASNGFSGAEIEQAIVAALYTAFAGDGALTRGVLLNEITSTQPLSRTMAERVGALREWAEGRTVSAN